MAKADLTEREVDGCSVRIADELTPTERIVTAACCLLPVV